MRSSEQVMKIAEALVKFNLDVPQITKNKEVKGQKYSFAYADLDGILAAVRKPMATCGLFHINSLVTEDNVTNVVTRLYHTSGEWFESSFPIPTGILSQGAQAIGGQLTYGKRYNITTLLGLAADEDTDARPEEPTKKVEPKIKDPVTEDMKALFLKIKDGITAAVGVGEVDGLNTFWQAAQDDLNKIKEFNVTAYEQLNDRYDNGLKALKKGK
jgi:hypothetical protein